MGFFQYKGEIWDYLLLVFFFISIIGSILHFTYDFSKHNNIVAIFSAVNESTWEHIKMALSGYFLWSFIDAFFLIQNNNYFFAKLIGLLTIILLIPLIFYGYKMFTSKPILLIDIGNFFLSVFLSQLFTYLIINIKPVGNIVNIISIFLIVLIFLFYIVGTFFPIKNFIFKDPITKRYGIHGHK